MWKYYTTHYYHVLCFSIQSTETFGTLELLISYKQGPFLPAIFPVDHTTLTPALHYHVADVSTDGQVRFAFFTVIKQSRS